LPTALQHITRRLRPFLSTILISNFHLMPFRHTMPRRHLLMLMLINYRIISPLADTPYGALGADFADFAVICRHIDEDAAI
jgi:hypothetical protein